MTGPVRVAFGEYVDFICQCGNSDLPQRFLEVLTKAWKTVPAADRETILEFYYKRSNWYPRVILGTRAGSRSPMAVGGGKNDTFMAWFDSLALRDMPGQEAWWLVAIGEELAHAFLLSSQHPTHTSDPPNQDDKSPAYKAWNNDREEAATNVLFRWPFDRDEHAKLAEWAKSKAV
jgi:hypothetical protein